MDPPQEGRVESQAMSDFARVMQAGTASLSCPSAGVSLPTAKAGRADRLNIDQNDVKNGLGQLVLTLVKLLHELLERQAIRHIDIGYLRDDEIERLGMTLMKQAQEIERLRKEFGLEEEDLNLDLGPLGKLL